MYLICYDIKSNGIRKKVADRLTQQGYERLQLSVFIGIQPIKSNKALWKNLVNWLLEDGGKLSIIDVSISSVKNMTIIGEADFDVEYYKGELQSLFF